MQVRSLSSNSKEKYFLLQSVCYEILLMKFEDYYYKWYHFSYDDYLCKKEINLNTVNNYKIYANLQTYTVTERTL